MKKLRKIEEFSDAELKKALKRSTTETSMKNLLKEMRRRNL